MTETVTHTPSGPAPLVTPGDAQLVARRPGRELFPSSWLRCQAEVTYDGGSSKGTLLEYCSTGLILQADGSKRLIAWDCLRVVELIDG